MGKIRVVIGANDLLLAGVQRLVIDHLTHFDRSKFDIHLIILMEFPDREDFTYAIPPDVVVHQLSFTGLLDISSWVSVARLLKSIKPQVVKTATFFSNTIFLVLKPLFGYAVVAAEHNTVNKKPLWQRLVDRVLFPYAWTVIGDSKAVVEFVSQTEHVNKRYFSVVYNGVDLDSVSNAIMQWGEEEARGKLRRELQIPEDAFVFLTAGRLVKQKNHKLMIDAFHLISKKEPTARLLIAGEGALYSDLEKQIADLGLTERVSLLGARKDLEKFYAIADTFVMSSKHEGFCIAAMEGLAFGLPLISTRVAGIVEYLEEGGNGFFADHTPESLAEKMQSVTNLSKEEMSSYKEKGMKTAEKYSTEIYGENLDQIILKASKSSRIFDYFFSDSC